MSKSIYAAAARTAFVLLIGLSAYLVTLHVVRTSDPASRVTRFTMVEEDEVMQEANTRWNSDAGEQHIRTVREEGESVADFVSRHKQVVDAMLTAFPKV